MNFKETIAVLKKTISRKLKNFKEFYVGTTFVYPGEIIPKRLFAALTDLYILNIFLFAFNAFSAGFHISKDYAKTYAISAYVISFALTYILPRHFLKRQTVGMWIFEWYNVDAQTKKKLSPFREGFRIFSQLFNIIPLFLPFLAVFFNKNNTHFADMISGSKPVPKKNNILNVNIYQKFIGLYLLESSFDYVINLTSPDPAIDFFGSIRRGDTAIVIMIIMSALAIAGSLGNFSGVRITPFLTLPFFAIQSLSPFYTLFNLPGYRVSINHEIDKLYGSLQTSISSNPENQVVDLISLLPQVKLKIANFVAPVLIVVFILNALIFAYYIRLAIIAGKAQVGRDK